MFDRDEELESFWLPVIGAISLAVFGVVAFLLWGPRPDSVVGAFDVSKLPYLNATINSCVTVALIAGWRFAVAGNLRAHKAAMMSAFGLSAAFLISYVVFHTFQEEPVRYVGPFRGAYLAMLISHIVLAAVILPLSLVTLYRGWFGPKEKHKRLVRFTLPIWLYVSISGVAIVLIIY